MNSFLSTLGSHRVKIIGGAVMVIGFLQGYPGLSSLLSSVQYAWYSFAIGILAIWFGSLKTSLTGGVLNNYKTAIIGAVMAVLAFIQGYPGLTALLSKTTYGWVSFVLGLGLVVCGLINTQQASTTVPSTPVTK